eukprot:scaffold13_cov241-Pinguiococcus_pyrenoidosus.AAC.46
MVPPSLPIGETTESRDCKFRDVGTGLVYSAPLPVGLAGRGVSTCTPQRVSHRAMLCCSTDKAQVGGNHHEGGDDAGAAAPV